MKLECSRSNPISRSRRTVQNLNSFGICSMTRAIAAVSRIFCPGVRGSIGPNRMIFNGRSMFSLRTLHFPTEAPAPARCCILPIGTVPLNYSLTERRTFTGFLNRSAGPLRSLRSYSEHQTAERKIGGVP